MWCSLFLLWKIAKFTIRNKPQKPSNALSEGFRHLIKAIYFHTALKVYDDLKVIYMAKISEFI
ncbi:protein of unknown function [Vibrio tapetis subsp. tapetis]|uniref:Uncharacterized protein n=1 Tax=Vibrio tapetis subsp. tapetis TaxID=1671868 RepID=A0A2N8ZAV8_9VIBR|nr:protein of unknown function [Vibrio tapetis subsp. tapetis]